MFDFAKLRGKIREICNSESNFAKQMGLNRTTVSFRLNGTSEFTASEIKKACDILSIPYKDVGEYFFKENDAN